MKFKLSSLLIASSVMFGATPPKFLGTVFSGGSGIRDNSLVFFNDTAYVINFAINPNNLGIIDFSNRLSPVFKGTISIGSNAIYTSSASPQSIYASNLFIRNSGNSQNIGIVNLQPGSASLLGTMSLGGLNADAIKVNGQTAFITTFSGTALGYFDASTANSQTQISQLNLGSFTPNRIDFSGNLAAVLSGTSSLSSNMLLLDTSNPNNLQTLGSLNCGFIDPKNTFFNGSVAYVLGASANRGTISTIDISNPLNPRLIARSPTGGGDQVYFSGTVGMIPNPDANYVSILDFSNPRNPILTATVSSGGLYPQNAAFVNNQRLFVANYGQDGTAQNPIGYITAEPGISPFLSGTITSGAVGPNGLLQNGAYGYVTYWGNGLGNTLGYFALNGGPLNPTKGGSNALKTASLLNTLVSTNACPQATLNDYYAIANYPDSLQGDVLNQFSPQYKVIQYSLEKLDYLLHKELESNLYTDHLGYSAFVIGGYDHLRQNAVSSYTGYSVDNYYQLLGMTYGWTYLKLMGALGASESYMKLSQTASKASYPTVWSSLGLSGAPNRWSYGIDALFGYSFIDTHRKIPFLSAHANSDHGAWNLSFDGKIAYTLPMRDMTLTPYDNFSYLYGTENDYTEHGCSGDNFQVKDEHLSVIRNTFGLDLNIGKRKSFGYFLDVAWMFEYFTSSSAYHAAFVGTDLYGTFRQKIPTKNYARGRTGFVGYHKNLEWKIAYTGLYGNNLLDSAVSVKFTYEF